MRFLAKSALEAEIIGALLSLMLVMSRRVDKTDVENALKLLHGIPSPTFVSLTALVFELIETWLRKYP